MSATARNHHHYRLDFESETLVAHSLRAEGFDAGEDGTGRGIALVAFDWNKSAHQTVAFTCKDSGQDAGDVAPTLRGMQEREGNANGGGQVAVLPILDVTRRSRQSTDDPRFALGIGGPDDAMYALNTRPHGLLMARPRRLTPRECERLQGFHDDYTAITYRGKPAADGPRYRALGNSMAVPVMRWIGERIQLVASVLEGAA